METSGAAGLNLAKQQFLDQVLGLGLRVAAFDCDGTLWAGDAGETFFQWEMKEGIVSAEVAQAMRARYAEYKAGKVSEDDMCGEMVTMHRGISETVMMRAASDFMTHSFPGRIFTEMKELVKRLHARHLVAKIPHTRRWRVTEAGRHLLRHVANREFGVEDSALGVL